MKRREFIKGAVAAALAAALPPDAFPAGKSFADMPYRELGRTGEKVSLLESAAHILESRRPMLKP